VDEHNPFTEDSLQRQCWTDTEITTFEVIGEVIDTPGQENNLVMRHQNVRTADGFVLVYSITSYRSFEQILAFQQLILRVKDKEYFPIILVGNHCERGDERQVFKWKGQALARALGRGFFEASSTVKRRVRPELPQLRISANKYIEDEEGPLVHQKY
jgi:GTPase KRas